MVDRVLRILSLGAGVQSSTLALMAATGEIDLVDHAIFADTGAEPKAVYDYLGWLTSGVLPFPVHIVSAGNIRDDLLQGRQNGRPPFHVLNKNGSKGFTRRQCTGDYKIDPIRKKIRELCGIKPRARAPKEPIVEQLIGISLDESVRMKPSQHAFITNRWPLIEKRMTRADCVNWMESRGYPKPPKSACTFCPFHSDTMWRDMRDNDRDSWDEAVRVDRAIRNGSIAIKGEPFLHASMVPLDEVDLSTAADHGQVDMFGNECEGMCGV